MTFWDAALFLLAFYAIVVAAIAARLAVESILTRRDLRRVPSGPPSDVERSDRHQPVVPRSAQTSGAGGEALTHRSTR